MEIIDKYGYLESALGYIEKNIGASKNLQKLSSKTGVREELLKKLASELKNFSEKQFFIVLQEKIERRHSSISGADVEISGFDISIEALKNKAFVQMDLDCDVVIDGEKEDKVKLDVKIFAKNNIQIS